MNTIAHHHYLEIGVGGGGFSLSTVFSYAKFAYGLPAGHVFQVKIQGISGYNELTTDSTNIQDAVDSSSTRTWRPRRRPTNVATEEDPSVQANDRAEAGDAHGAERQRPGRFGLECQLPARPAGATRSVLRRQGSPPTRPTGTTSTPKIYYDPTRPGNGKLAARAGLRVSWAAPTSSRCRAKLDLLLERGADHGHRGLDLPRPARAGRRSRTPPTRQPPNVRFDPSETYSTLFKLRKRLPFRLEVPTVLERSSYLDSGTGETPAGVYRARRSADAATRPTAPASTEYWGIQMTRWADAPRSPTRASRSGSAAAHFDLHYSGSHLHMVVLRENGATYWVVNTLLDSLSNETMLAIARGLAPDGRGRLRAWREKCRQSVRRRLGRPRHRRLPRRARSRGRHPRRRSRSASRRCGPGGCRSTSRVLESCSSATRSGSRSRSTRDEVVVCADPVRLRRHAADVLGRRRPLARSGRSSTSCRRPRGAADPRDEEHGAGRDRREGARAPRRARARARRLRLESGVPLRGQRRRRLHEARPDRRRRLRRRRTRHRPALYEPLGAPIVRADVASAEMIKLAANAFLMTRISFINEIANVCEATGADVRRGRRGRRPRPPARPALPARRDRLGRQLLPEGRRCAEAARVELRLPLPAAERGDRGQRAAEAACHRRSSRSTSASSAGRRSRCSASRSSRTRTTCGRRRRWCSLPDCSPRAPTSAPGIRSPTRAASCRASTFCERVLDAVTGADAAVIVTEWDELKRARLRGMRAGDAPAC